MVNGEHEKDDKNDEEEEEENHDENRYNKNNDEGGGGGEDVLIVSNNGNKEDDGRNTTDFISENNIKGNCIERKQNENNVTKTTEIMKINDTEQTAYACKWHVLDVLNDELIAKVRDKIKSMYINFYISPYIHLILNCYDILNIR